MVGPNIPMVDPVKTPYLEFGGDLDAVVVPRHDPIGVEILTQRSWIENLPFVPERDVDGVRDDREEVKAE